MEPRFRVGDRVRLAARPEKIGIILGEARPLRGNFHYQVFFSAADRETLFPEKDLALHQEINSFREAFQAALFLSRSEFLRFLILQKIRKPLIDNIYTFYSSRTDFQVHQFKPVLKFISSVDQRLFLADEVGLGKTIEAGIILSELDARLRGLARVLVACPAALVGKWEQELNRRFGETFRAYARPEFWEFLDRYQKYGDSERLRGICTLQMLRSQRVLDRLEDLHEREHAS